MPDSNQPTNEELQQQLDQLQEQVDQLRDQHDYDACVDAVQDYYANGFAFIGGLAFIETGPGAVLAAALGYQAGMSFGDFMGSIDCVHFYDDPFGSAGPGGLNGPGDYIFP